MNETKYPDIDYKFLASILIIIVCAIIGFVLVIEISMRGDYEKHNEKNQLPATISKPKQVDRAFNEALTEKICNAIIPEKQAITRVNCTNSLKKYEINPNSSIEVNDDSEKNSKNDSNSEKSESYIKFIKSNGYSKTPTFFATWEIISLSILSFGLLGLISGCLGSLVRMHITKKISMIDFIFLGFFGSITSLSIGFILTGLTPNQTGKFLHVFSDSRIFLNIPAPVYLISFFISFSPINSIKNIWKFMMGQFKSFFEAEEISQIENNKN